MKMDSSAAAKDAGLVLSDRTVKGITRKKVEVKAKGIKKAKTLHKTQEEAENFAETWVLS